MKKSQVVLFTVVMLVIGFVCRFADSSIKDFNSQNLGMLIWLLSPFVLVLVFRAINRDWKSFGVRLHPTNSWPWYVIALLLYPIVTGLLLLMGKYSESIQFTNSFSLLAPAVLSAVIPSFIKNIFEEFTWRGYLTQQLDTMGLGRFKNHLVVGAIWALWHLPFLDLMIRSYSQASLWVAIPVMFVGIVVTAFVYGELRLRSKSVWPAVILHTVGNSITNPLISLNIIQLVSGREFLATPMIDNVAYSVLMFIIAFILFRLKTSTTID